MEHPTCFVRVGIDQMGNGNIKRGGGEGKSNLKKSLSGNDIVIVLFKGILSFYISLGEWNFNAYN